MQVNIYNLRGDYNWWWKSFIVSASPALYVFLYSIYYFFTLNIRRVSSIVLYFGMMSLVSSVVFLMCGTMGFVMTYVFIKKIYSMIKID
jgi:transmembrane 9 superfamily protein 2/4